MMQPVPSNSPMLFRVLGQLGDFKQSGEGWKAHCPGPNHGHGDRTESLSISTGYDGRVLLKCFAGCPTEAILTATNMTWTDLFEKSPQGGIRRRYRILDSNGHQLAEHQRDELPSGKKADLRWTKGTKVNDLPLYRLPDLLAADTNLPVYICEGENKADALVERGLIAVSGYGVGYTPSNAALLPLQGRQVRLWPDNDTAGREWADKLAARLTGMGVQVRWVEWSDAPEKGDAADFTGSVAEIEAMVKDAPSTPTTTADKPAMPKIYTASELQRVTFPDVRWAIPGLLPEGLTILAGRPKLGKSWLGLCVAVEIARGGLALGRVKVQQGEALYMALEDGDRRIKERLALILGDEPWPSGLHIVTEWPKLDFGGLALLEDWLDAHPLCRYVGVDTFKRVRPRPNAKARLYDDDYEAMQPLAAMARERAVAVMPVLHARKGEADDPLDMISGTTGLSGAADAAMVLRRERGQADASLFLTGRDVEERDMALKWHGRDADYFHWEWIGEADDMRLSRERQDILDMIERVPGMKPGDLADAMAKTRGSVRYLLFKLVHDGKVRVKADGTYWPEIVYPSTNTNSVSPYHHPAKAKTPPCEAESAVSGTPPTTNKNPETAPSPSPLLATVSTDSPLAPLAAVSGDDSYLRKEPHAEAVRSVPPGMHTGQVLRQDESDGRAESPVQVVHSGAGLRPASDSVPQRSGVPRKVESERTSAESNKAVTRSCEDCQVPVGQHERWCPEHFGSRFPE